MDTQWLMLSNSYGGPSTFFTKFPSPSNLPSASAQSHPPANPLSNSNQLRRCSCHMLKSLSCALCVAPAGDGPKPPPLLCLAPTIKLEPDVWEPHAAFQARIPHVQDRQLVLLTETGRNHPPPLHLTPWGEQTRGMHMLHVVWGSTSGGVDLASDFWTRDLLVLRCHQELLVRDWCGPVSLGCRWLVLCKWITLGP